MINFDSLTLKAFLKETESIFLDGRIQKIQQPSRNEILLSIRSQGQNHKLYININPQYPHIAFIDAKGDELREIKIPQKPPMFCMLLRKYMEGSKIKDIRQPNYERILEISIDSYNELGDRVPIILACEIMGKHSNIILYNADTNVIIGSAHNVGPEKSREREISGGLPYVYPPKQNKYEIEKLSFEEFSRLNNTEISINQWLNKNFHHLSLALSTEICNFLKINSQKNTNELQNLELSALYSIIKDVLQLKNINPSISKDKKTFSLFALTEDKEMQPINSVNSMINLYYGYQINTDKISRLTSILSDTLKKELKKLKIKYEQHKKNINIDEKAEKYKQYGDILTANLYKLKQGIDSIELENYFEENKLITIPLDSQLSPSMNTQRYYKLYNKAKIAAKISQNLLEEIETQIKYLESIEISIKQAENLTDLYQIKEELISENLLKEKQKTESPKHKIPIKSVVSSDGYQIFIGKNNKQNDFLISKIASQNDIWMHTQNIPGSHVLIKTPSDMSDIPEKTLHEAANLAVYFSSAKNSSNVPIIYTKKKFLKKPPCAKPGYVTYSNEKTLVVTLDEEAPKILNSLKD